MTDGEIARLYLRRQGREKGIEVELKVASYDLATVEVMGYKPFTMKGLISGLAVMHEGKIKIHPLPISPPGRIRAAWY